MRRFFALAAAVIILGCAPLPAGDYARSFYSFEIRSFDSDLSIVRIYCDDHQIAVLRGWAVGERRVHRVRGQNCGTIRLATYGIGGRMLYYTPSILVNPGDTLEIELTEYPQHTRWRTNAGPRA